MVPLLLAVFVSVVEASTTTEAPAASRIEFPTTSTTEAEAHELNRLRAYRSTRRVLVQDEAVDFLELNMEFELPIYASVCELRDAIYDTQRNRCFRCPDGCILSSLFEGKFVAPNLFPAPPEVDCICGLSYEEIQLRARGLPGVPGFLGVSRKPSIASPLPDPPARAAYGTAVWQTASLLVDIKCPNNNTYDDFFRRGFNGLPLADSLWWLQRFDTAYGLEDIDTLLANASQAYNDKLVTLFLPLRSIHHGIQRQIGPTTEDLMNCQLDFPLLSGANGEKVASISRVGDVPERKRSCNKRGLKVVRPQVNAVMRGLVEASRQTVRCQEALLTSFPPDYDWRHIPDLWGTGSKLAPGRARRVGSLLARNDFYPTDKVQCTTIRKQLRLRAINMMQRALSYTGTDAANGCWEMLESVATFSMEKVSKVTDQCTHSPADMEYWISPCCNKQLLRIACCAVRNVTMEQPVVKQINTSLLGLRVHVDPTGGVSYGKRVAMTALAWRRRLTESSGCPSCHRNWAIHEQAHIDAWRNLDRCHADIMGRYDRTMRMFVGSPCLVDSDCYTQCVKPRIHTLQTKVRLLRHSKIRRQILGHCRVPTTERHKYLVKCLLERGGDEIRELLGEELGIPAKQRTEATLVSNLNHASRKTFVCIGPLAARDANYKREECLAVLACNWNHELSSKDICERSQHLNMDFCSCREGWCPQLSLRSGCITTQVQMKDCQQAREFLAKHIEFGCISTAKSSEEMERCNVLIKWHDDLLQRCLVRRCSPATKFVLDDDMCYDTVRREFNACHDTCNIPSGPNPILKRRVCYLELWPNETAEACFQTPGDPMVHYRPDDEHLGMKWVQREKAQYCSIRIWKQLQDVTPIRNRLQEEISFQNANSKASIAAILQHQNSEKAVYEARVSQMRDPAKPADCEMGEIPMEASAKSQCRSRNNGCCLSPRNVSVAYCDTCDVVNTTVCPPGEKVFARWAPNNQFYGSIIKKNLGNDLAEVDWDDGTQFYREVVWPHIFTFDGIACAAEAEGCAAHHQCKETQYCMSCEKCAIEYGGNPPPHLCAPCPAYRGGACRDFSECETLQSSIDGQCIPRTETTPCRCKSEWNVRGQYPGAPTEDSIKGCFLDVSTNMRWCEVDLVGNCTAQSRLGVGRFIYWNTCEPSSCADCQCDCSQRCMAYDVLPVLGRLPESLGIRVGAGNQITDPVSYALLRIAGTVAPNCSLSGPAYIRGLCSFCTLCCADLCHSLAIGVPPGSNATTIARAERHKDANVWDCTATNVSGCINAPRGWVDSVGRSCNDYKAQDLCTHGGLYGKGWPAIPPTTFESYEASDKIATDVCCECGGGIDCTNIPLEWEDANGDDCLTYSNKDWCSRSGYGSGWQPSWGAFPLGTGGIDALAACCDCGGGKPYSQAMDTPTLHMVADGSTCQIVWPGRAKWRSPPWIAKNVNYCRKTSNICMRKLMAFNYDPSAGKNVPDDPRIFGLCEQRNFITGVFSFKEDFEQSLVPPGGRRLSIFYQVAQRWLNDYAKSLIQNGTLVSMDLYANSGNGMCYYRLPDPFRISGGPNREDMPPPWLPPHTDPKQQDVFSSPGMSYLGWPREFWSAMPNIHPGVSFDTLAAQYQAYLENDPSQINAILRVLVASNGIELLPESEKERRNALWLYAYQTVLCAGEVNEYAKYTMDRTWQPAKFESERECVLNECNIDTEFIGSNSTLCTNAEGCTKPCVYCSSEAQVTEEQGVCYTSLEEYVDNDKCAELGGVLLHDRIFDEHLGVSRWMRICVMLHMPLVYCTVPGFEIKRCINFDEDHCEKDVFAKLMRCALDIRPCATHEDCGREGRCSDADVGLTWMLPETCVVTPIIDELVQRRCDSESGLCFFRLDSPFGMEVRKLHDLLDLLPHEHLDAEMAELNNAGRPLFTEPEDADRLLTRGRLSQPECQALQGKIPDGHKAIWLERSRTAKECSRWQACCISRFGNRCSLFTGPIYDRYGTDEATMGFLMTSCSNCGGEWIDVFTWTLDSGWIRGALVDSQREWYERKFTSANAWADVVDLGAVRELYENTLETYIGKKRRDTVECLLEPLLVALETVAFAIEAPEKDQEIDIAFPVMPSPQFAVGSFLAVGGLRSSAFLGNVELKWHQWSSATLDLGSSSVLYSFFVEPFELSLASAGTQLSLPGRAELVRSRLQQHVLAPEATTTPLPPERAVLRVGDHQGYPPWLINQMLKLDRPNENAATQASLFLDDAERKRIRLEMEEKAKAEANAASGLPLASKNLLLTQMVPGTPAYKSAGLEGLFNNPCRSVVASSNGEVVGEILGDCVHVTSSSPLVIGAELCLPLLFSGATLKNTNYGEQVGVVLDFARKDRVPSNYSVQEPAASAENIPGEVAFRMWRWQSNPSWGRLPPDTDVFVPLNLMTRTTRGDTVVCASIFQTNVTYCPIARLNTSFFARLPRKFGEPELPPPDSACPSLDFLLSAVQEEQVRLQRTEARYKQSDMTASDPGLMSDRGRYETAMAMQTEDRGLPSCPVGSGLVFKGQTYRCESVDVPT